MSMSEYDFRKLDEVYGLIEDARKDGRCPTCGCLLIIGRTGEIFAHPTCPNCGFEKKS